MRLPRAPDFKPAPNRRCSVCDRPIHPKNKSGRCWSCSAISAWEWRHQKKVRHVYGDELRAQILVNLKARGIHPQCRGCKRTCKQYAARDATIVYCPAKEEALKISNLLNLNLSGLLFDSARKSDPEGLIFKKNS
jgi:hypothetical protein